MSERIPFEEADKSATARSLPGRLPFVSVGRGRRLFVLAAFCVVVLVAGPILDIVFDNDAFLASAVGAIATATFFGLFYDQTERNTNTSRADAIRDTLAGTFVLVYLVLVTINTFFSHLPEGQSEAPLVETTTLLNSFTQLTAVVVAFYFGTTSLDKYLHNREQANSNEKPTSAPELEIDVSSATGE